MNPADTARQYVDLFNTRQFRAMGELFAEDGLWQPPPHSPETRGRAAIIAGYEKLADFPMTTNFTDASYYVHGNVAVVEMKATSPDSPQSSVVDVFEVDDAGKILRMTAYTRPPASP